MNPIPFSNRLMLRERRSLSGHKIPHAPPRPPVRNPRTGAFRKSAIRNPQSEIRRSSFILHPSSFPLSAFTLVELLVSTAIIALIMLMLVQVTNNISAAWRGTAEKVEKFQEARDAFEAMNRRISQATLNTYWDYYDLTGVTRNMTDPAKLYIPFSYGRQSDLKFVSGPMSGAKLGSLDWSITAGSTGITQGALAFMPTHGIFFQSPLGKISDLDQPVYNALNNLLNTWGYFIEIGADTDPKIGGRPAFLDPLTHTGAPAVRWRSRLMEFREPAENMSAYENVTSYPGSPNARDWFEKSLAITTSARPTRVMAENIIALILYPRLSKVDEETRYPTTGSGNQWNMLSPYYTYDSSVLPPTAGLNLGASGTPPTLASGPHNPGPAPFIISKTDAADAAGINPRNQLPPIITVTIVALDERSAQRLIDLSNPTADKADYKKAIDPSLKVAWSGGPTESLYQVNGNQLFTVAINPGNVNNLGDAETPGTDMYAFTQKLVSNKLTYRIFSTNVTIRAAKWSRAQVN